MDDAAGSSMLDRVGDRARHTLTVKQVWQQLFDAGVPRSERRVKVFCQDGTLDAGKLDSPTGKQWYINAASVPGLIGELKQFNVQKESRLSQHAATGTDRPEKPNDVKSDAAGNRMLEPAATELKNKEDTGLLQHAAAGYVSQLEKRIEEKDQTIKFLQDELVDRRSQIGGMKEIIDGQRLLLESINNNVAPVFTALAEVAKGKSGDSDTIRATIIDEREKREEPVAQS